MREELLRIAAQWEKDAAGCERDNYADAAIVKRACARELRALAEKAGSAESVAKIIGIDEYGPMLEWSKHWVNVGVGAKLYAAAPPSQPVARTCTCHPDDNPPRPCAQQYALDECRKASQPVALPDGWVAVPREPTEAMLLAGYGESDSEITSVRPTWAAMIAAAPAGDEAPRG